MRVFRKQPNNIIIYNAWIFLFSSSVKKQGRYMCIHRVDLLHRFRICKFTYSLKFICNPKSNFVALLPPFTKMCKVATNLDGLMHALPAEVKEGNAPPSCFSSNYKQISFHNLFSVLVLQFCAFSWWLWCLNLPPTEVLKCCSVSLSKENMCLR